MNAWVVFRKELIDAFRDRRTLLMVLLSSVAIGPLVLVALSALVAGIEKRAEDRTVVVSGIEHAPTLHNYLLRQTYRVDAARPTMSNGWQARRWLTRCWWSARISRPSWRAARRRWSRSFPAANQRASASVGRLTRLLRGFSNEQATLRLAVRGITPATLEVLDVQERDLANPQSRAARLTGMVPFFVLMAVLYGALNAALDTTAGERERGSLEPLLMNPASRLSLVLGKWGAVAAVGMLIALLSCFSFLPAQGLLRSETLGAMSQFGLREAGLFLALLAPLPAALGALMMAIAIRCKTFKEAQANRGPERRLRARFVVRRQDLPQGRIRQPGARVRLGAAARAVRPTEGRRIDLAALHCGLGLAAAFHGRGYATRRKHRLGDLVSLCARGAASHRRVAGDHAWTPRSFSHLGRAASRRS